MNDAHAAVYPFDVSQVEGGGITADLQNSNVELTPAGRTTLTTAASRRSQELQHLSSRRPSYRPNQNGRIDAQVSQDLHPIQGSVRDVAAGTGGRTIRRASDLAGELEGIVDDGRATYQLSFSPARARPTASIIILRSSSTAAAASSLRYRTGYLFAKEPASLKDRFREAVWQPSDTTDIGVSASVAPSGARLLRQNQYRRRRPGHAAAGRPLDGQARHLLIQRDDAGIHAHVEGTTLGLRLKPSTYQNLLPTGVPFERAVEMQPGMGIAPGLGCRRKLGPHGLGHHPLPCSPRC